jgi:uncharacterized membrane protein YccC
MGLEENLKIHPKLKIVLKASILTTVILTSYFIGYGISFLLHLPNNYISGMWCAATAVVVFDDLPLNAKTLMKDRTLGSFVGTVVAATCISLIGHLVLSVTISLLVVCSFIIFFKLDGTLKIACITVMIVGVTTHGYADKDILLFAAIRFFESVIGGAISLFATIFIDKLKIKLSS